MSSSDRDLIVRVCWPAYGVIGASASTGTARAAQAARTRTTMRGFMVSALLGSGGALSPPE
jgi:hypothetical protein